MLWIAQWSAIKHFLFRCLNVLHWPLVWQEAFLLQSWNVLHWPLVCHKPFLMISRKFSFVFKSSKLGGNYIIFFSFETNFLLYKMDSEEDYLAKSKHPQIIAVKGCFTFGWNIIPWFSKLHLRERFRLFHKTSIFDSSFHKTFF